VKKIKFSGKVFSGKGGGKKFVELEWVKRQINAILGFTPYAGTLNIRLSDKSAEQRRKLLENAASLTVRPAEGYYNGKLFKASIGMLECAIVIPEVAGYPENVLEIIAPVNLREKLQLADGDEIVVTVSL
jgi:riboflavin kinase